MKSSKYFYKLGMLCKESFRSFSSLYFYPLTAPIQPTPHSGRSCHFFSGVVVLPVGGFLEVLSQYTSSTSSLPQISIPKALSKLSCLWQKCTKCPLCFGGLCSNSINLNTGVGLAIENLNNAFKMEHNTNEATYCMVFISNGEWKNQLLSLVCILLSSVCVL